MSQETPIGNLGGGISNEDSKLVDSILNDINNSTGPQQGQDNPQGGQGQQPSPEQIKMMQQQQMMRQQALVQQQAHQQAMAQQQAQQQAVSQQKMNMIQGSGSSDIMENIKLEAKNIMTVVFLCILFNIEQVDNILKNVSIFVTEGGGLNMQAVFLKSIMIGIIFYIVKTYLL